MKISLIMPFYDKWQMTHQRLMEMYKFIHPSFDLEIILINDNPDDKSPTTVGWWQKESGLKIRYFKNSENLGFGGSMNKGAEKAEGDILIFFSNDVIISGDFVREIVGLLHENKKVLLGGRRLDFDTGWNHLIINRKMMLFPYVEGWLISCWKEVWEDLGGFDSVYGKFDFEDVDLSTTAIHKGYEIIGLNSKYLQHMSGTTIRGIYPDRERYTRANIEKFKEKWSKLL